MQNAPKFNLLLLTFPQTKEIFLFLLIEFEKNFLYNDKTDDLSPKIHKRKLLTSVTKQKYTGS